MKKYWVHGVCAVVAASAVLWATFYAVGEYSLRTMAAESRERIGLHKSNLENVLNKHALLPDLLAKSEIIASLLRRPNDPLNVRKGDRFAQEFKEITKATAIYVLDQDGGLAAANGAKERLPFIDEHHKVRPYFENALAGLRDKYLSVGGASERPALYFFSPVLDPGGGPALGVAVVRVDTAEIEESWRRSGEIVMVTDLDGVVLLSSEERYRFSIVEQPFDPYLERNIKAGKYGANTLSVLPIAKSRSLAQGVEELVIGAGSADSRRFVARASVIPGSEWVMHVYMSTEEVARNATNAVLLALFGIVIVICFGWIELQRRASRREKIRHDLRERDMLIEREEETRLMTDNTDIGLITSDLSGRIERINPVAARMVGGVADEGKPGSVLHCFPGNSTRELRKLFETFAGRYESHTVPRTFFNEELTARGSEGQEVPMQVSASVVMMHGEPKLLFTLQNLTELKRSEEELRRAHTLLEEKVADRTKELSAANERLLREIEERIRAEKDLTMIQGELIQAAKMAVLGQMAAGVTHEINQPLSAIMTYSNNALKLLHNGDYESLPVNLDRITRLVNRMARITSQLKAFARKSDGPITKVSVRTAIEEVLFLLDSRFKKDYITINWEGCSVADTVKADLTRIEQVIMNLLTNAIDAVKGRRRRAIWLSIENQRDMVTLRIRDSGPGFDKDIIDRIFDPFFTTKGVGGGLGLGLSISSTIVESFRARIRAENAVEGGAVFIIQLPFHGKRS